MATQSTEQTVTTSEFDETDKKTQHWRIVARSIITSTVPRLATDISNFQKFVGIVVQEGGGLGLAAHWGVTNLCTVTATHARLKL